nr:DnaJ domain-containing protein [Rhodovibrio sodomensis]
MSRAEALEILGLPEGASREEVQRAYRSLIKKLHPDTGGSDWFAAKLNEAKRVLIGD